MSTSCGIAMHNHTTITIVIPTYNRLAMLVRCVQSLLPQMDANCTLIILDNASSPPVGDVVQKIVPSSLAAQVHIYRSKCNIGAGGNVTRCLEQADMGWIWILGDDDIPKPDALKSIQQAIASHLYACVLTFDVSGMKQTSSGRLLEPAICTTLKEYLANHSILAQSLISSSLYNVDRLKKYLPEVYHQIFTLYPHLSMTLLAMQDEDKSPAAVTLPDCIVEYTTDGMDKTKDRMLPLVERAQNLCDLLPDAEALRLWDSSDFGRFLKNYGQKSGARIQWSDVLLATAFKRETIARRTLRRAAMAASAKFKTIWMCQGIVPLGFEVIQFVLAVTLGTLTGPLIRLAWALKSKNGNPLPSRVREIGLRSVQNVLEL